MARTGLNAWFMAGIPISATAPTNGYALQYNSSANQWQPTAVAGTGTVTTVSVASANGFTGTVATATTTPVITIIPGASNTVTQTMTNKRVTPRVLSAANYTTDTGTSLNCDTLDVFIVTAQAGALKFNNPTGTATDGQVLFIAVTGTAGRALTRDTQFEASTIALPSTTTSTARLNMRFMWRADTSKWVCILAV